MISQILGQKSLLAYHIRTNIVFWHIFHVNGKISKRLLMLHLCNCWLLQWTRLCNAFLLEAQWFASGNMPKAEEYMKNAHVSTGLHVVLVHMFFLLGEGISKDTVDLLDSNPSITSSIATILRLWDDLGNAQVRG